MLWTLFEWLRPRWSIVVFWAIDLRKDSRSVGVAAAVPRGQRAILRGDKLGEHADEALTDVGANVDPEALLSVAQAVDLTATEAASRVARGAHCLTMLVDGQVATACWVSAGAEWLDELEGWFVPGRNQVYVWDCATRPVYRGRHLYPALLHEILRGLTREGYDCAWIATEWDNWRSARGVSRAGFRPVAAVVAMRLLLCHARWVIPHANASPERVRALRDGLA